ncbi:tetratricopeptide repeat-containing sulfotransferase family protein [Methylobacterium sp. WSM2598]|uniref:tetratricopeptide repeat-containing sulfotransferase family protein n=1 Tax=Methylobacterium sp. WSM2598 TaxID=398261 RepID=UPI00037993E3|nr:tetratricopeptide repeat-containing sulfotransferase family protein [Methylobacterium sp. WSM2598]
MNAMIQVLCECGSGLTPGRCCALEPAAGAEDPLDPGLREEADGAAEALRSGDRAEAERASLAVLERAPRLPVALATLGEIRFDEGRSRAATALMERLTAVEPFSVWPINKLGLLALQRGDADAAERHARQAVRLAPEDPQAHNLMGMAMTEAQRPVIGEYHCRRALDLAGRRIPLVLANLATCLKSQGRIREARDLYREAAELRPDNRQTLLAWARLEEADRRFDAALDLLDAFERLGPPTPGSTLARAMVLGRQNRREEALALLDGAARTRPLTALERLERGRLLDRLGRHDEAWADFEAGKRRMREVSGQRYLAEEAGDEAARLKAFFTRTRLAQLPRAGVRDDMPQPLFILGFPRSGTTLVEQTLTKSPLVSGGDELPLIHEIAWAMPRLLNSPFDYPGALAELWMADQRDGLDRLRDHYLQRARQLGAVREGARFFTNKMPLNEVHLGLIALLFPRAPLLHLVRHPLDIMVSAMSNLFTHGAFCGAELESAARHLVLSADLVAHYRAEMDLHYLPVRYEDMVDDQEGTLRRVLDFVGVPFEADMLRQETNPRYARTASYAQVTEPLYDRSRYRYRHYLRQLQPVLPILRPLIERLGYTVEDAAR